MPNSIQGNLVHSMIVKSHNGMHEANRRATTFCIVFIISLAGLPAYSQVAVQCGQLEKPNSYGPFDYTNSQHFSDKLPIVEEHHFTPEVETFQGHDKCGGNGCEVAGDIDYTLRAFPNHHRALLTMSRYHIQGFDRSRRPMGYTAECYFDRALRFKPEDSTVHMIYGFYLSKLGNAEKALGQFEIAVDLAPNSAEAHYNLGLLYTEAKAYDKARLHAARAYNLGFPLPGLRRKLERAGQWQQDLDAPPEK